MSSYDSEYSSNFPVEENRTGVDLEIESFVMMEKQKAQFNSQVS